MTTRKQVEAAAKKAGFAFEVDSWSVFIGAPKGHALNEQTYGQHYSEWPVSRGEEYTKAYAYECCMEIIKEGHGPCECGECVR